MNRPVSLIVGLLISASFLFAAEPAGKTLAPQFNEYQAKAAYLLNFTQYIEWPPKSFKRSDSPIVIGILGQDRFGEDLRCLVADKFVESRRVVVRKVTNLDHCKDSQILFISQSERSRIPEILRSLKSAPVLTVGETDSFVQCGGIISFHLKDDSLSLDINQPAAGKVGLKISSKLLQVAEAAKRRS